MPSAETRTATVLVTDMAGSTAFRAKWGDDAAEQVRRRHAQIVRSAAASYDGTVIKSTGDGALVTFGATTEAIAAAISVQQESIALRAEEHAPPIRIGLASGDITFEDGDCFGRPVIEATRLEGQALPDGILATKLVELMSAGLSEANFIDRGEMGLKGFPDPVPVAEIHFDVPEASSVATDAPVAVVGARLAPPVLARHTVERPRVDERFRRALKHRVAVVEAGAGYGKSTAAASHLLSGNTPWCWVSCDSDVTQPIDLVAHVCAALATTYPGFGLDHWPENGGSLAGTLARQIQSTVVDPMVVCVDDVHLLDEELQDDLGAMVGLAPPPLLWLLLSRRPIRLPADASLDLARPIVETDLAFNATEARELIAELAPGAEDTQVERIHRETEGWVAGLVLSARGGSPGGRESSEAPFDYLAAEALRSLPASTVDALERLSMPYRFNDEIAEAVTGDPGAGSLVRDLVARHMFTIPLDSGEGWFRFHHLFRAVLAARLHEREDIDLAALRVTLGHAWMSVGEADEAVKCFLDAEALDLAADTLSPLLSAGIVGARYAALRPLLERLPDAIRMRHPDLVVAEAAGHLYDGRHERAYRDFERSIELLMADGQHSKAAGILARYFQAMITAGSALPDRVEVAERFLPILGEAGDEGAAASISGAVAYGHSTHTRTAARIIDGAVERSSSPAIHAVASALRAYYVCFPDGDINEAISEFDRALTFSMANPGGDIYGAGQLATGLKAAMLPQIGAYDDALALADEAEASATRAWGSAASIARVVRWWRLNATVGLGEWDRASSLAGDPRTVLSTEGDLWSYRLAAPYARIAAISGDATLARRLIRHGRAALADGGPTMDGPMVLCDFAHAAADIGSVDLQAELTAEALSYAADRSLFLREAHASMHRASVTSSAERDVHIRRALTLTRDRGYEFLWLLHERDMAGELLGRAMELDEWRVFAAELVADAGGDVSTEAARSLSAGSEAAEVLLRNIVRSPNPDPRAIKLLAAHGRELSVVAESIGDRPRAPLHFRTFGGLSIERAGKRLPRAAIQGEKQLGTLLGRLIAAWPDGLDRKVLASEVSPESSQASAELALDDSVRALNERLDPWVVHRPDQAPIHSGAVVSLVLTARDQVDFAPLLDPQSWNDADLARLRSIERDTLGGLLPEFSDEEWLAESRSRLERARTQFVIVLAERLRASGQAGPATDRLNALVEKDPEREELHRRLMRCYVDAGEPAKAMRQYHACRAILQREHGIEPSAETRALFEALV